MARPKSFCDKSLQISVVYSKQYVLKQGNSSQFEKHCTGIIARCNLKILCVRNLRLLTKTVSNVYCIMCVPQWVVCEFARMSDEQSITIRWGD